MRISRKQFLSTFDADLFHLTASYRIHAKDDIFPPKSPLPAQKGGLRRTSENETCICIPWSQPIKVHNPIMNPMSCQYFSKDTRLD